MGHPYRVPVKYKNTPPEPKYLRLCRVGASVGFCRPVFCCATFISRTAPGVRCCFAPASSFWFHSSSPPAPRRLFCAVIHPDPGRASCCLWPQGPGPIPTPSGPEQRQYRTLFNRCPSRRTDVTDSMELMEFWGHNTQFRTEISNAPPKLPSCSYHAGDRGFALSIEMRFSQLVCIGIPGTQYSIRD